MKRLLFGLILALSFTAAEAATRFAVCTTACTWDNASTAMWSTSSGGATGASFPTINDSAIFDAATCVGGTTCTTTVNANVQVGTLVFDACTASTTGCILDFSVNNNTITFGHTGALSLSTNGSGTRTIKMGNGQWIFNNATSGAVIVANSSSNLTLVTGSGGFVFNLINGPNTVTAAVSPSNNWGNWTINGCYSCGEGIFFITGGVGNFGTVTVNSGSFVNFNSSTTLDTLVVNGTNTHPPTLFGASLTINTSFTGTWAILRGIACGGAGTGSFTNTFDAGGIAGGTIGCNITPPSGGGGTTACILGGWLLWRDMPGHLNDNYPAWLDKAG